jgi:ankyrin repeat protein
LSNIFWPAEFSEVLLAKVKTPHGTAESTPLHEAVETEMNIWLNVLLSHGAAVDERNDKQETALHLATNCNIAECLLKHGAHVNAVDSERRDAAVRSVSTWQRKLGGYLLQYGADPNGQSGKIPLFVACQNNNGSACEDVAIERGRPKHC